MQTCRTTTIGQVPLPASIVAWIKCLDCSRMNARLHTSRLQHRVSLIAKRGHVLWLYRQF
ncbi:MAG TPA: hypothetical protein VGQ62_24080 [Chloroflexota bacterium]|nr:hypothetical protein [Chloroflexota bacterium]